MNGMADMALTIPVYITGALITFFQWTFQGTIVNLFVDEQTTGGVSALDNMVRALKLGLFANLAALAVVIAALMLAYRAFIKNTGMADFASKLLIMTLIAGFIAWFTPNASWAVRELNNVTNSITGDVFAAFSKAICAVGPAGVAEGDDLETDCELPKDDGSVFGSNAPPEESDGVACYDSDGEVKHGVDPVDCIGQVLYHSLIFTPWATGLLGPLESQAKSNGEKVSAETFQKHYTSRSRLAYATLEWQGYSRKQIELLEEHNVPIHGVIGRPDEAWVKSAIDSYKGYAEALDKLGDFFPPWVGAGYALEVLSVITEVQAAIFEGAFSILKGVSDFVMGPDPIIVAAHPNAAMFSVLMGELVDEEKMQKGFSGDYTHKDALTAMFQLQQGENADSIRSYEKLQDAVKDKHKPSFNYFTGRKPEHRFMTVLLMFIAMIAFGGVLISVSMGYLVLQLMCVILVVVSPLVMLIGLIPDIGTRVFLKWVELFLGTFLKRIGLGIAIGLLMTLYAAILSMPFQWYAQLALLVGIALAGIAFRKKVMEMAGLGSVDAATGDKFTKAGAKAPFKAAGLGGKGLMGTQRAGRLFASGMQNNLKRTEGMVDKNGKKVGGLRRGAMAVWAGGKGAAGGMQADGSMFEKQQRARAIGGQHARKMAERRGHMVPKSVAAEKARSKRVQEERVETLYRRRYGAPTVEEGAQPTPPKQPTPKQPRQPRKPPPSPRGKRPGAW